MSLLGMWIDVLFAMRASKRRYQRNTLYPTRTCDRE
ncbi:hypothetical protein PCO31111_02081 [Pandoraea communis]|uniref:Uncharacterized protein n=1 Tax=Pandoraea communis TaxID=2508297 RepID=A0A5E4UN19_9BURK|nr:hypothetical protein PCO31111_02081 [Pandoraea communis]